MNKFGTPQNEGEKSNIEKREKNPKTAQLQKKKEKKKAWKEKKKRSNTTQLREKKRHEEKKKNKKVFAHLRLS